MERTAKTMNPQNKTDLAPPLRLDPQGLPLIPQPTPLKDDPLNWSKGRKWAVVIQAALLAFLGPFNSSLINPVLVPLSLYFKISVTEASYQTTTVIVAAGVAPLVWSPLSNKYGRRPVLLISDCHWYIRYYWIWCGSIMGWFAGCQGNLWNWS